MRRGHEELPGPAGLGDGPQLTLAIYRDTHDFPDEERFGLTSQIRRSSASIAANLAERCGRRSEGEMARFIQISMGSGAELSYHLLLLARDLDFLKNTEYSRLNPDLEEVLRMLSSLSKKVRNAAAA
jgi:four helix bundle protein